MDNWACLSITVQQLLFVHEMMDFLEACSDGLEKVGEW